jgi:hypothetical protein
MPLTLRHELFAPTPAAHTLLVAFYSRILRFAIREQKPDYTYMARDGVYIGILTSPLSPPIANLGATAVNALRRPPCGVEFVLETDDVDGEWAFVAARRAEWAQQFPGAAGWGDEWEAVVERPWGLRDFRVLDPEGYYVRITGRAREGAGVV